MKRKLLGYYNYTVVLTYIGMLSGFVGIVKAFENDSLAAIVCLMIAGFCDMFDGAIASTNKKRTEQEKCFGIQIDSLSDLICFGVFPASIAYSMSDRNMVVLVICGYYVLCALIRLAYFNVDEMERQKNTTEPRMFYYGMPVTLSAAFIPMIYGICSLIKSNPGMALTVSLVIMGLLFLLPFKLPKAHKGGKIALILFGIVDIILVVFASMSI